MEQLTLRGQSVEVDLDEKILYMTIRKPTGKAYSISDKISEYVDHGFTLKVDVAGKIQTITDMSKSFKKEKVPSKFAGLGPWYRYWFVMEKEDGGQQTFW